MFEYDKVGEDCFQCPGEAGWMFNNDDNPDSLKRGALTHPQTVH